jgi:hypothetical protein
MNANARAAKKNPRKAGKRAGGSPGKSLGTSFNLDIKSSFLDASLPAFAVGHDPCRQAAGAPIVPPAIPGCSLPSIVASVVP